MDRVIKMPESITEPRADVLHTIAKAAQANPRSQQTRIGPSGLGHECDRCLGAMLAEHTQDSSDTPWLPTIGTAVHTWIGEAFDAANIERFTQGLDERWLIEETVIVGAVGGVEIDGSCDLYDLDTRTVIDHKLVGASTLKQARVKVSEQYRRQVHLYAAGMINAGHPVEHVAINYLPRNAKSLDAGYWFTEGYKPDLVAETLARADSLARAIGAAGAEIVLPQLARASGCFDCHRFPLMPGEPAPAPSPVRDRGAGHFADIVGTDQGVLT